MTTAQSPSSDLQRAATQREQTNFLRASDWLQKSAFYFSALQKYFFLPGKEIFASHIACVKSCKVKSAVMSVETQQRKNDNKNPKANKASLRSYGTSEEFTNDLPAPTHNRKRQGSSPRKRSGETGTYVALFKRIGQKSGPRQFVVYMTH